MCCQSFSPSEGSSASQVGRWDLKCSIRSPRRAWWLVILGLPGKELLKGLPGVGIALEKKWKKLSFPERGKRNSDSQECCSVLFSWMLYWPECFGGLSCVWERNTKPSHTHPVDFSTLVLLDLIKWLFSVLAVTGWGCEHDKMLNGERTSGAGSFVAQSCQHYLVEWRKMVTEAGQVSAGLFSRILHI